MGAFPTSFLLTNAHISPKKCLTASFKTRQYFNHYSFVVKKNFIQCNNHISLNTGKNKQTIIVTDKI